MSNDLFYWKLLSHDRVVSLHDVNEMVIVEGVS